MIYLIGFSKPPIKSPHNINPPMFRPYIWDFDKIKIGAIRNRIAISVVGTIPDMPCIYIFIIINAITIFPYHISPSVEDDYFNRSAGPYVSNYPEVINLIAVG